MGRNRCPRAFYAGSDLKAIAAGKQQKLSQDAAAALGPTHLLLNKPVETPWRTAAATPHAAGRS
jgi:hypothetical protein